MPDSPPKIVLITGATRGLGRAMVPEFIKQGCTVVGCGRSQSHVDTLASEFPAPHRFDRVDVRHEPEVAHWAACILKKFAPPDLLLNNAAIINQNAPLWQVPVDQFSSVIDVNIKGIFHVLRHFLPAMISRRSGVIVNFSSGWGRSTSPEVAPYCATKYAVEGLTLALAQELPAGMAAVPLNPGIINTEMLQSCFAESAGQFPSPQKWARSAVPFLLRIGPAQNGQSLDLPG